eukprot:Sspe_Gene.45663::Locus_22653_Transcript_1_1_Confidence_1.000_Length_1545::g.45663::m.45663
MARQRKPVKSPLPAPQRRSWLVPSLIILFLAVGVGWVLRVDRKAIEESRELQQMAEAAHPNKTRMRELWYAAAARRQEGCPWVPHIEFMGFGARRDAAMALASAAFAHLTGTPYKRSTMRDIEEATANALTAVKWGLHDDDLQAAAKNRVPGRASSTYEKLHLWAQHRQRVAGQPTSPRLPYFVQAEGEDVDNIEEWRAASHPSTSRWDRAPPTILVAHTPDEGMAMVRKHGYVTLPDLLSPAECQQAKRLIRAREDTAKGDEFYLSPKGRKHLRYDPADPDDAAMVSLARSFVRKMYPMLRQLVGDDADLAELASFSTQAGAASQMIHMDGSNMFKERDVPLYTVFVVLQDTSPTMGPLHVFPDTHELRADFRANRAAVKKESSPNPIVVTASAGTGTLMDGTVYHRGSAHTGGPVRDVLYCSFVGRGGMVPFGTTYALYPHMIGKYTLRGFLDMADATE